MSACAALSVSVLPAFQSVFQPAFVRQLSVLLAVPFVFRVQLRGCLLRWLCLWLFGCRSISRFFFRRFCLNSRNRLPFSGWLAFFCRNRCFFLNCRAFRFFCRFFLRICFGITSRKEVSVFVISCAASLAVLPLQPTRKIIRQARTQGISLFFISIAPFCLNRNQNRSKHQRCDWLNFLS